MRILTYDRTPDWFQWLTQCADDERMPLEASRMLLEAVGPMFPFPFQFRFGTLVEECLGRDRPALFFELLECAWVPRSKILKLKAFLEIFGMSLYFRFWPEGMDGKRRVQIVVYVG